MTGIFMYYLNREISGGKVTLGHGSPHPNPPVLKYFPDSVTPPMIRTHLHFILLFSEGQAGEAQEPANTKKWLFVYRGVLGRKALTQVRFNGSKRPTSATTITHKLLTCRLIRRVEIQAATASPL